MFPFWREKNRTEGYFNLFDKKKTTSLGSILNGIQIECKDVKNYLIEQKKKFK